MEQRKGTSGHEAARVRAAAQGLIRATKNIQALATRLSQRPDKEPFTVSELEALQDDIEKIEQTATGLTNLLTRATSYRGKLS